MKHIILLCWIFLIFLVIPVKALAIVDPLSGPNNRFGIHIVDPNDLTDAAALVNSSGGDWGYVTLIITKNDRHINKWQDIFDQMRRLHLTPIVRIATQTEGPNWQKPDESDISSWADFLNSLNWVTRNRFVVIFNEPNHANEWGGSLDPAGYAHMLSAYYSKLKEKSPDFFILPAGLDASAPNSTDTMDEQLFLEKMKDAVPDIFDKIDGWSSHSYPNPGFSGSPFAYGKGTVRTYQWEKNLINSMNGWHNFPIFITETGWAHREGVNYNYVYLPEYTAATYITAAFSDIWTDPDIAAITPFVLNYQSYPFDNFSWEKPDKTSFYSIYQSVQNLKKIRGAPVQITKISFLTDPVPAELVTSSEYNFKIDVKNEGQSILSNENGDRLIADFIPLGKSAADYKSWVNNVFHIEPGPPYGIDFSIKTPATPGEFHIKLSLVGKTGEIRSFSKKITVTDPPSLQFHVIAGINRNVTADDVSLIIYDAGENPVQKFTYLPVKNGRGEVFKLRNVAVGKPYRIVIQKPYYLPRQEKIVFQEKVNEITFKPLLPLDMDLDGRFSFHDYLILIFNPLFVLSLLF